MSGNLVKELNHSLLRVGTVRSEDTITVPIPITHPDFKDLTTRTEKRGAIGLDLPTWFNLKNTDKRIMLVAQDPLRGNTWYSDAASYSC